MDLLIPCQKGSLIDLMKQKCKMYPHAYPFLCVTWVLCSLYSLLYFLHYLNAQCLDNLEIERSVQPSLGRNLCRCFPSANSAITRICKATIQAWIIFSKLSSYVCLLVFQSVLSFLVFQIFIPVKKFYCIILMYKATI